MNPWVSEKKPMSLIWILLREVPTTKTNFYVCVDQKQEPQPVWRYVCPCVRYGEAGTVQWFYS